MSGQGRAAGAVNVQRKTWDKSQYAEKAKERAEGLIVEEEKTGPAPYRAAPAGLAGPAGSERAYLPSRDVDLQLDSKLGKKRLVTEATPVAHVGGYWCEICQCTLADSTTYLDHINGIKHQRRMGFSMRVERSTVDSVKARLKALKEGSVGDSAAKGGSGRGVVLDAEDRYALAAMDHPDIAVVAAGSSSDPRPLPASLLSSRAATGPSKGPSVRPQEPSSVAAGASDGISGLKRGREQSDIDSHDARAGGGASAASTSGGTVGAEKQKQQQHGGEEEQGEEEDEMAAALGFAGFGGSKKSR